MFQTAGSGSPVPTGESGGGKRSCPSRQNVPLRPFLRLHALGFPRRTPDGRREMSSSPYFPSIPRLVCVFPSFPAHLLPHFFRASAPSPPLLIAFAAPFLFRHPLPSFPALLSRAVRGLLTAHLPRLLRSLPFPSRFSLRPPHFSACFAPSSPRLPSFPSRSTTPCA